MPVCGCSAGPGCKRTIEVAGHLLEVQQSWHAPADGSGGGGGATQYEKVPAGLGTCVWEGGLALLRVLELSPSLVKGKSVLELGCGTGVVSLACVALGAARVVATDHSAPVLDLAKRNVAAHAELLRCTGGAPAAQQREDGAMEGEGGTHSSRRRLEVLRYEWGGGAAQRAALGGPFDVVLGGDVTYDPGAAAALMGDIDALVHPGAGRAILAFARRPEYRPELLLRSLEEIGTWRVLWPLSTHELDDRDAPPDVLARWVPDGLAVAHATRQPSSRRPLSPPTHAAHDGGSSKPGEPPLGAGVGGGTGDDPPRAKAPKRKWATTNFESGEVVF
eukprot:COSAG01_NODE_1299_length_10836_cov_8.277452_8_plen_333_part_00